MTRPSLPLLVVPAALALSALALGPAASADSPAAPPIVVAAVSASAVASSTPPAPPTVTLGLAQVVRGGPAPKTLASALRATQSTLDACYAESIAKEGEASAGLRLRLEIDGTGRVVSSTVAASEDASSRLRGCVRDAFAGRVVGTVKGMPLELSVPIAFARDAGEDTQRPGSACPAAWEDDGIEGELPDELRTAIRDRAARAGFCFKRPAAAGEPPTVKGGTMELHVRVAPDGSVCGVSAVGDGFARPSLTSCVLETMSAPFDAKPLGTIEVVVPLAFQGT